MTRVPLAGADLFDWIALRRVSDGGVTRLCGCWLDRGRRAPGHVAGTLSELLAARLIALADQEPGGTRRSTLTDSGSARYERLVQQRQAAMQVPAPRFAAAGKRADVDDPDPPDGMALPDLILRPAREAHRGTHPGHSQRPDLTWWAAVCLTGVICLVAGQRLGRVRAGG
ncbi:MAG: hypothetical protein ACRDSZ_16760 [Pseudonocardiaceae bacterium]